MLKVKTMVTSSVISWCHYFVCNEEMSKNPNPWKSMKIAMTEQVFISSERFEKFQWSFQGRCDLW